MSKKSIKQDLRSPLVVTSHCSKLKHYLSLCRQPFHLQPPPLPALPSKKPSSSSSSSSSSSHSTPATKPPCNSTLPPAPTQIRDGRSAAKAYLERVHQVELELLQLEKWLNTEKRLVDCLNNSKSKKNIGDHLLMNELIRLEDGSYLRGIKQLGRPSNRLAMQVSIPVIAEDGTAASEVLLDMASMGMEDLLTCLIEAMPMGDISGHKKEQIRGKTVSSGSETGFMQAIVMDAMEKMEGLALEGLRIQASETETPRMMTKREQKGRRSHEYCIVLVMLIQIRDPMEDYEAVGDLMICLVEASADERVGGRFNIEGLHVAGVDCMEDGAYKDGFIWSTSIKECNGKLDSSFCKYVRNKNIAFAGK